MQRAHRRARAVAALSFLLGAGSAAAHELYPIAPVDVSVRIEPDRVVADINVDSIYWIEEILANHHLPPRDWPEPSLRKAEDYLNAHLRIAVDQRPIAGRLASAQYIQRPWQVYEQGRMRFRMIYPPANGAKLSGRADFYDEYRLGMSEEHEAPPPDQDFRTRLSVLGPRTTRLELVPGSNTFDLPIVDSRRGEAAMIMESVQVGAATVFASIECWPALIALALSLSPGWPSARRAAVLAIAAVVGAAFAPPHGSSAWVWALGMASAAGAGRWLGATAAPYFEAATAAGVSLIWATNSRVWLPRSIPGPVERSFAGAGAIAAAAAMIALVLGAVNAHHREIVAHSQSRAADLFERRRRLAATVLLLACAWGAAARISL